jgi:hypothetical protein
MRSRKSPPPIIGRIKQLFKFRMIVPPRPVSGGGRPRPNNTTASGASFHIMRIYFSGPKSKAESRAAEIDLAIISPQA